MFALEREFDLTDYNNEFKSRNNCDFEYFWVGIKKSDIVGHHIPHMFKRMVHEAQEESTQYQQLKNAFLLWDKWMQELQSSNEQNAILSTSETPVSSTCDNSSSSSEADDRKFSADPEEARYGISTNI